MSNRCQPLCNKDKFFKAAVQTAKERHELAMGREKREKKNFLYSNLRFILNWLVATLNRGVFGHTLHSKPQVINQRLLFAQYSTLNDTDLFILLC